MQHSSNTKTWANDDALPKPNEQPVITPDQPAETDRTTQEAPPSQGKRAKVEDARDTAGRDDAQPEPMVVDSTGDTAEKQEEAPVADEEPAPVSDSDWLRSKTSRLLGLLDEEEQAEFDSKPVEEEKTASPVEPQVHTDSRPDEESVPQDTKEQEDGKTEEEEAPENDPNVDLIRSSARLFIRNLPYDTTDSDLEPTFTPFGKVEEVSCFFHCCLSPVFYVSSHPIHYVSASHSGCLMMNSPDRDIRCNST